MTAISASRASNANSFPAEPARTVLLPGSPATYASRAPLRDLGLRWDPSRHLWHGTTTAERDLLAAASRAGLGVRVSRHDLRRSSGRMAGRSGAPQVALRNLLGHETIEMTIDYVGADADEMAAGLERFERAMRESITVPDL